MIWNMKNVKRKGRLVEEGRKDSKNNAGLLNQTLCCINVSGKMIIYE